LTGWKYFIQILRIFESYKVIFYSDSPHDLLVYLSFAGWQRHISRHFPLIDRYFVGTLMADWKSLPWAILHHRHQLRRSVQSIRSGAVDAEILEAGSVVLHAAPPSETARSPPKSCLLFVHVLRMICADVRDGAG
jgi:hypothetical protein